jgi:phosphotransferase system enzyme I (PtsI)
MVAAKTSKERRLKGAASSPGIAIGLSFKHDIERPPIIQRPIPADRIDAELHRLDRAIASARRDLEKIRADAGETVGPQLAKIFEAELLILDDTEFLKQVAADMRKTGTCAEYIYNRHITRTIKNLAGAEESYLQEMASDIKTTAGRVLSHLVGPMMRKIKYNKRRIALADTFSPGEVVLMNRYRTPGFASMQGGPTSHVLLVARALSVPAVVGVVGLCKHCTDDCEIIIDGDAGEVIVNPSEQTREHYRSEQKKRQGLKSRQLRHLARLPEQTLDGHKIKICANVDFPSQTDKLLAAAGVDVGLYRTEFFYLSGSAFPSETEQADTYLKIAETFFPNQVTLRVFDLGSDKVSAEHAQQEESNPALGWRGIRFDLDSPAIFRTQIRAILRASKLRNLKLMLPMVSMAQEIVRARRLIRSVMDELRIEKVPFDEQIEVGVMIEVPAAALMAPALAHLVDFFSIGTNDLVQYTLAADRGNTKVVKLYRELHPAVLKLIQITINAGEEARIPVSLCGEMASELESVPLLVGMGLTRFSVTTQAMPPVRKLVSKLNYEECRRLATRALKLNTTERVEALLYNWYADKVGG